MPFSLLHDPWLPLRRSDGRVSWCAPPAVAEPGVVAIAWPRADFRLAATEFLLGLLATAMAPRHPGEWAARWDGPPSPEELAAAFAPFAPAFLLDGEGPRFGQDLEELPGAPDTPESLLIEAPGEATLRKNTALLVKSGRVARLSRAAAATALHTLQAFAPSGGRGNLTSLRGGGPLTTLVLPGEGASLWQTLWANVPQRDWTPPAGPDPLVFPWMAPTRTSETGRTTSPPNHAHPLQCFWGMPRRVRLDFAANPEGVPCDLGGPEDAALVTGWRQRPYGVRYAAWRHPLTPYYEAKGTGWLPAHPQPGGIGYRHWLALVVGEAARRPAEVVRLWHDGDRYADAALPKQARLLAAGFDMDNAKARGFVESEMPLPGTQRQTVRVALDELARRLVRGAEQAAFLLRGALRDALAAEADASPVQGAVAAFWTRTEAGFFASLRAALERLEREDAPDLTPEREAWRGALRRAALAAFDAQVPMDAAELRPFRLEDGRLAPPREVRARLYLHRALEGRGKGGAALFEALNLAAPDRPPAKTPKSRRAKEPA